MPNNWKQVERVARALFDTRWSGIEPAMRDLMWADAKTDHRTDEDRRNARAAIDAMREAPEVQGAVTGERTETDERRFAIRIRSYIGNLTGEADDPFYQAVLALWGAGFDYAHGLRACGHSIGDWRDPNYNPEKPDQPLECRCVGCEREALLRGRIQAALDACEGDFLRCEQCDHQQDGAIRATDLFILVKASLEAEAVPATATLRSA